MFPKKISINMFPRLHLNLFSMQAKAPRVNGGVGFSVGAPCLNVNARCSESFWLEDVREHGLDEKAKKRLLTTLEFAKEKHGLNQALSIIISGNAGTHYSFGSGTAIRLACLESLLLLNNCQLNKEEIITLSGRGGTSGIGIHTYYSGGLVVELGRKNEGALHVPSSQAKGDIQKPLLFQQVPMPEWDIGVCIPSHIKALTEEEEKSFFMKTCPIPEAEAHKAMYHAVAGVYAAVMEADKPAFEQSIRVLQECGWKKAEREVHGRALSELEQQLYAMGATAVGMSSLGPSLFFFADDMDAVICKMQKAIPNCQFIKTRPVNSGRVINHA